jgi:peptide/nickel transport system permease protein
VWRYLVLRVVDAVPTVFLVVTLVFVAMRILPGDPAVAILGDTASPAQIAVFRERMGLNEPLWRQYLDFLIGALTFDFGNSLIANVPVTRLIAAKLPYTLELTLVSTGLGLLIGVPMGVLAATRRNTPTDQAVRVYALTGFAVPDFFLGALLLIGFALHLGWFPIGGAGTGFLGRMYHIALPALTLAVVKSAFLGRLTRTAVLEVLGKDFVRTARAKGAPERRVVYRHALRNALLPVVTALGLSLLATLSGSIAIELVFNRPGIGEMLIGAIAQRDYPVVQGGIIVFALFVVLINLLVDIAYVLVDPRVRVE